MGRSAEEEQKIIYARNDDDDLNNNFLTQIIIADEVHYFKSEVDADEILAFIAIRAKVYTLIRAENGDGVGETIIKILSKLKGVNKDYVNTLGLYQ